MTAWTGQHLGGYLLEEELGHDATGIRYRGKQLALGREVVVIILPSHLSRDPAAVARFLRQAHILAQLNHPNIVQIYDAGQYEEGLYVVLEDIRGLTIRNLLDLDGRFPPHLAAVYTAQVADALEVAYQECRLIYRDLKPEHLMLDWRGQLKVTHFGLARARGLPPITTVHALMSSFAYASPEQLWGKPLDHRSDIYTLGIVFYEMVTGIRPFAGRTFGDLVRAMTHGQILPPSALVPEVSPELEYLLFTALAASPDERFAHAGLMADALRALPWPTRSREAPAYAPNTSSLLEHIPTEPVASAPHLPLLEHPPSIPLIRGRLTLPMRGQRQTPRTEGPVPDEAGARSRDGAQPALPFWPETDEMIPPERSLRALASLSPSR